MTTRIDELERRFPSLRGNNYRILAPLGAYNCLSYANGDTARIWHTRRTGSIFYWPPELERDWDLENITNWFLSQGYIGCDSGEYEPGYEKVALYVSLKLTVTHVAKQNADSSEWISKLADEELISHESLRALTGIGGYGYVACIMKRQYRGNSPKRLN